ncbi:MAG: hypothetical protein HKN70_14455 [Gammaproteobacteria bacterium]|nr:hypothetical protein [Gammaproteobacteria bacterium]
MKAISEKLAMTLTLAGMTFFALSVSAGDAVKSVKILKIDSGDGSPVELRFDGDTQLESLADGETRTLTTANGEAVTVTRNGDQLSLLTSSGKTVQLPVLNHAERHSVDSHHEKRQIKIVHRDGDDATQIMIVSPGGLSDQEQATIRQAIQSAGIDKEILFIGGEMEANIEMDIEIND